MRERVLKNQVAVFGRFNFPPIPEVTVSLLQSFSAHSFMPLVLQQVEQGGGQVQTRLSLVKDQTQIIFGSDRIDIIEGIPEKDDLSACLGRANQYMACLQSRNLEFNRIALVTEKIVYDLANDQKEKLRERFAPNVPAGSTEWGIRWVQAQQHEDELLNVCLDVSRFQGVMQEGAKMEQFDGVKVLHDVSTHPQSVEFRFNPSNFSAGIAKVAAVVDRQMKSNPIEVN